MVNDSEMKVNYDHGLANPPEDKRKYWNVHSAITLEFVIPRYGTRAEVEEFEKFKLAEFAKNLRVDSYTIEITEITEQEGE